MASVRLLTPVSLTVPVAFFCCTNCKPRKLSVPWVSTEWGVIGMQVVPSVSLSISSPSSARSTRRKRGEPRATGSSSVKTVFSKSASMLVAVVGAVAAANKLMRWAETWTSRVASERASRLTKVSVARTFGAVPVVPWTSGESRLKTKGPLPWRNSNAFFRQSPSGSAPKPQRVSSLLGSNRSAASNSSRCQVFQLVRTTTVRVTVSAAWLAASETS